MIRLFKRTCRGVKLKQYVFCLESMNRELIIEALQRAKLRRVERKRNIRNALIYHGGDILSHHNFKRSGEIVQHGTISVKQHSTEVAKQSLKIARGLRLRVKERELIRGALLHDYFLYDWHKKDHECADKLHGFEHPKIALRNALRDFKLTRVEKDIIRKHMWPLTIMNMPKCKEAWIVSMADKYVSTLETLRLRKGNLKRKKH